MRLTAETRVDAPPAAVFGFFEDVADRYEAWHPDHITFEWVEGDGLAEGNVAYFEEEIGGDLKAQTVEYAAVERNAYIELRPTSRLIRLLLPRISFTIDPENGGCRVTQRVQVRTGPIGRRLNKHEFEAVHQHMIEEGENLKRIVEAGS